jgi:hypothetical protein
LHATGSISPYRNSLKKNVRCGQPPARGGVPIRWTDGGRTDISMKPSPLLLNQYLKLYLGLVA